MIFAFSMSHFQKPFFFWIHLEILHLDVNITVFCLVLHVCYFGILFTRVAIHSDFVGVPHAQFRSFYISTFFLGFLHCRPPKLTKRVKCNIRATEKCSIKFLGGNTITFWTLNSRRSHRNRKISDPLLYYFFPFYMKWANYFSGL